jgi:hypothetical protein
MKAVPSSSSVLAGCLLLQRLKVWTDPTNLSETLADSLADSPSSEGGYIKAVPGLQPLGSQRRSGADLAIAAGQVAPVIPMATAPPSGLQLL